MSLSSGLPALTPAQTTFVKHLNGLAPVATSIVTPFVANAQFRQAGVPDSERKLLVFQEIVRQGISSVVGLTTYYGGMLLTGKFFKGSGTQKTLAQIIGGTVMSFIGYGFIRPMVSSEIIARWLLNWQQAGGLPVAGVAGTVPTAPERVSNQGVRAPVGAPQLSRDRFAGFRASAQASGQ